MEEETVNKSVNVAIQYSDSMNNSKQTQNQTIILQIMVFENNHTARKYISKTIQNLKQNSFKISIKKTSSPEMNTCFYAYLKFVSVGSKQSR